MNEEQFIRELCEELREELHKEFKDLCKRMDKLIDRMDNGSLSTLESRSKDLCKRMDKLTDRMDNGSLSTLESRFSDGFSGLNSKLKSIDSKFSIYRASLSPTQVCVPGLQRVDYVRSYGETRPANFKKYRRG